MPGRVSTGRRADGFSRRFRWLHLNLAAKIALAVGGVLLISTSILARVAVSDVRELGSSLQSSYHDAFLPYQQARAIDQDLERTEVAVLEGIAATRTERDRQRIVIDNSRRGLESGVSAYAAELASVTQPATRTLPADSMSLVVEEQDAVRVLRTGVPRLNADVDSIFSLADRGRSDLARAMYETRGRPRLNDLGAAVTVLMSLQLQELDSVNRSAGAVMQGTETSIAETIALTFVLALIAIALLARQITHPLRSLVVGTAAVRRGDLSPQVQVTTRDELGLLGAAFNTMVTALRDERDRSQRYLNTAESILLALDIKGRITLVNRYTCSLLGWTADELLGRSWVETCLPPRIQRNLAGLFDNLLDGDMREVDNVVVTRSGQERLIEWHNTLLRDDDGVVIGTFSSGTDITERTKAVDALRVTEERMRFALEAAGVGIWDMNFATGRVKWSQILEAQCGLRPGTFDGSFRSMLRCIHRDDRKALFTTIRDAMRSGSDFTARLRSQWADGTVRCLSAVGRIHLDAKGKPVRAVGVSMDVSDAQELEQQFRQAQKMEAIGQLAGGVAHDFNNLLTAILGYCELLLEDVTPVDPRRTDIIEIQKAGVSAASLTRQLLAFSRKQLVAPTVLDVGQVAMDMQAIVRRLIREDVKIVLDHQPALGLVLADRAQIEQVVMNLVVNARDAMPNGGTLTIRTASVELDELYTKMHVGVSAGSFVSLTVSDTGIGMTPLVRSRLFEPFFTTKGAGSGTGLGLSTVHGIVMASGGHIDVVSEVGKGTSFTVYLPRTCIAATIAVGPEVTPVAERMATHTVLVVDDAEGLAELAKRLLERQGYTVLVATNTVEAMRLFEEHPSIDVVLTDVVMPDVSGPQLTSWLLARRPSLKVIYMSGYAEEALVHDAMSSPGVMFLNKPFTADILGRTIRDLFERPKPRPSRRPPKPLARIA